MKLATIMDEIGDALDTITGLRVYRYPAESIRPPSAVVDFPDEINYMGTYSRGLDSMTIPVYLSLPSTYTKATRDPIAAYCDGSGPKSIKTVLEGYASYTEFDTITVAIATFDMFPIGGIEYWAAKFDCQITGSGTT